MLSPPLPALVILGLAGLLLAVRWPALPQRSRVRIGAAITVCGLLAPALVGAVQRGARLPSLHTSLVVGGLGILVVALYAWTRHASTAVAPQGPRASGLPSGSRSVGAERLHAPAGPKALLAGERTVPLSQADSPVHPAEQAGEAGEAAEETGTPSVPGGQPSPSMVPDGEPDDADALHLPPTRQMFLDLQRAGAAPVQLDEPTTAPDSLVSIEAPGARHVHTDREQRIVELTRRLHEGERRLSSEHDARRDAEALVHEQRGLLDTLDDDLGELRVRIATLETALGERDAALDRANRSTRSAARLARDAATARADIQLRLDREITARERLERATDRAVAIARSAIAALPDGPTAISIGGQLHTSLSLDEADAPRVDEEANTGRSRTRTADA